MEELSVRLMGGFQIVHGSSDVPGFEAGKSKELFGYLLLNRNRPHSREMLAGILWEECPTTIARKNLRQALWNLQSALTGIPNVDVERFLRVSTDAIRLDVSQAIWLDVAIIEEAYSGVRGTPGERLSVDQAGVLGAAVALYEGDLLEGWYHDWCIHARESLQQSYLTMLDKLMAYAELHEAYEDGIVYGERTLQCDPARERTHRRLMRLHFLSGDRTGALRQFDRCVVTLERELGVAPAQSTLALAEDIRADHVAVASDHPTHPPLPALRSDIATHLREVQMHLIELHEQLQIDIRVLERP
jgi:DNA-binding SARP family transcriptional activator